MHSKTNVWRNVIYLSDRHIKKLCKSKYLRFLQCDKAIEAKEPFPMTWLAQRRPCLDLYWVFGSNQRLFYCRSKTQNISKKELVELIHFSHFWCIKTLLLDCDNLVLFLLPLACRSSLIISWFFLVCRTYLKLPWRPLICIDGSTIYELDDKFKVKDKALSIAAMCIYELLVHMPRLPLITGALLFSFNRLLSMLRVGMFLHLKQLAKYSPLVLEGLMIEFSKLNKSEEP